MKMYILIKDTVPDRFAPVISAHASLACYRQYEMDDAMQQWVNGIFKKVVCRVDAQSFEKAKEEAKHVLLTESALANEEVGLAFCPRVEFPKYFSFFPMWKPSNSVIKKH